METYEGIADIARFSAALHAAAQELDCATFIIGERHLECFHEPNPTN